MGGKVHEFQPPILHNISFYTLVFMENIRVVGKSSYSPYTF